LAATIFPHEYFRACTIINDNEPATSHATKLQDFVLAVLAVLAKTAAIKQLKQF